VWSCAQQGLPLSRSILLVFGMAPDMVPDVFCSPLPADLSKSSKDQQPPGADPPYPGESLWQNVRRKCPYSLADRVETCAGTSRRHGTGWHKEQNAPRESSLVFRFPFMGNNFATFPEVPTVFFFCAKPRPNFCSITLRLTPKYESSRKQQINREISLHILFPSRQKYGRQHKNLQQRKSPKNPTPSLPPRKQSGNMRSDLLLSFPV